MAYTPPSGFTPAPPRRSTNPMLIVLGVCGGCALIGIIAAVAVVYAGFKSPMIQRIKSATLFVTALQTHKYSAAEAELTPDEQREMPEEKLSKYVESFPKKYGPYVRFNQGGVDMQQQSNPNSLQKITYTFIYERGQVNVRITFDPTSKDGKISKVEFIPESLSGTSESGSGSGETGSGKKR